MKATVLNKGGAPEVLHIQEMEDPTPGPGMARVRLKAAGINHRDLYLRLSYAGPEPMILGSDGAGTVDAVGDDKHQAWVGRDVVINPSLHWGDREEAYGPDFEILGLPTPGTYAEAIVVPVENLAPKPAHLDYHQAAALPLAGLTAWRALFTRGQLKPGQTVLLPGIGSGVAGLALMLAKGAGARVIVTSSDEAKLKRALAQGADFAVNYTDEDWEEQVREVLDQNTGGIDMVLDHSGAKTIPAGVRLVKPGGRVVFLGATTGTDLHLDVRELFRNQVNLHGTYMGSPREFADFLRFVASQGLQPEVHHVYPLEKAAEAHQLMEDAGQFGKIILSIP